MSWLSLLFKGDPTANKAAGSLVTTGSTATGQGFADTTASAKFLQGILKGDTSVLAPQVSSIQKQGQQKIQSLSQFGNRSGGTNAAAATTGDTTRASINDLIAQLTGSAASSLGSLGTSLLNTGTSATSQGAQISMQNKSFIDQLLQSVGGAVGTGLGTYLGKKL